VTNVVITLEERKRAFQRPTEVYVPKNLKSKLGKLCLQRFYDSEDLFKQKTENEITPEFAKSFIMGGS
jgi:hypothetical protein